MGSGEYFLCKHPVGSYFHTYNALFLIMDFQYFFLHTKKNKYASCYFFCMLEANIVNILRLKNINVNNLIFSFFVRLVLF